MPRLHKLLSTALLVLLALLPNAGHARSASLLVIVGRGTALTDVSTAELRRLFMRNANGIDGRKLVPFNQPPKTDTRLHFDQKVLGMSDSEVGRYWIDRRIRGESGPPTIVPSSQLMLRVIASLPNSIGYMREDEIDASVRVLTVNGKKPSDPDYPLK